MPNKYLIFTITIFLLTSCVVTNENEILTGNWIEIMPANPEITQGITLNPNGSAASIGMETLKYEQWKTDDGKLMLCGKSIGNGQTIDFSDTLNIVKITTDSLILDKYGMYRIGYYKVANTDNIKPFNVLDSLETVNGLTELQTRNYKGLITDSTASKIEYSITIYNYKHCGNGVWKLTLNYPGYNNSKCIESFGRMYTLRGDADNINAVVYQMIPFSGDIHMFFLYLGDKLELLNKYMQRPKSSSNKTLTLQ